MSTYVYENKTLHINRHRRKEDKAPNDSEFQETEYDGRRRKIKDGILFVDYDHRQQNDPNYSGPERRSGVDRRSDVDRRNKQISQSRQSGTKGFYERQVLRL